MNNAFSPVYSEYRNRRKQAFPNATNNCDTYITTLLWDNFYRYNKHFADVTNLKISLKTRNYNVTHVKLPICRTIRPLETRIKNQLSRSGKSNIT